MRHTSSILLIPFFAACTETSSTGALLDAATLDAPAAIDTPSAEDLGRPADASEAAAPDAPAACVDQDEDGYPETDCAGMPADCDDHNGLVHPGRPEVCDMRGVDEDCNPCSVAGATDGDGDGDTFTSAGCFNRYAGAPPSCDPLSVRVDGAMLRVVGRDCDDLDANVRPNQSESCNNLDDNCNGMVDEGAQRTFYRDADGDGFGDRSPTAMTRMGCSPPAGYVESNTDCDDDPNGGAGANPGAREVCDVAARDENCNGTGNEGCMCAPIGASQMCCGGRGVQTCAMTPTGAEWSACSAPAVPEVCNNVDDNCNGVVDERVEVGADGGVTSTGSLRTVCYRDYDGDSFAPSTASAESLCPPVGMSGTCPAGYTARAPASASSTDCNDDPAANGALVSPMASEVCNGRDDDCDGLTDERGTVDRGLRIDCYPDADRDGFAPRGAAAVSQCRVGAMLDQCPTMFTPRAPVDVASWDCSEVAPRGEVIYPGRPELCNGYDDNCVGGADEGCACPVMTSRSCYDGTPSSTQNTRPCMAGTQRCDMTTTGAAQWGACTNQVTPINEICGNGRDDDCNGQVDEAGCPAHDRAIYRCQTGAGAGCVVASCQASYGNCDGNNANGCETYLADNPVHCGACGRSCSGGNCINGACTTACLPGEVRCSGVCADLDTSPTNCGRCGVLCRSPRHCDRGVCIL